MTDKLETTKSSEWFDAEIVKEKPSFFGGAVVFMLCFIAIFANVAFGGVSSGVLGIIAILLGVVLLFWIVDCWKSKKITFSANTLLIPFLGLILIGVVQLLPLTSADIPESLLSVPAVKSLSLDPYSTRFAVLKLVIYFGFLAASLTFINNQRRVRKVVFTIIVFAAVMAFIGILQRLATPAYIYGIREVGDAIPFASYINQHHFATFLEMSLGLTLGLLLGGATKRDKFLLLGIAAVLMGIAIVFTGSRGGMISLLCVIGFLVVVNVVKRNSNVKAEDEDGEAGQGSSRNWIMVGGCAAFMVVLLGAVVWLGGSRSVERAVTFQTGQKDITSGRSHFWGVAVKIIRDNPIIGSGLDSFGVAYTKYDSRNGKFRVEQAHNEYLQILSDAGVFGLLFVIAFIVLLFWQSFRVINNTSDNYRRNVAIGALAGCVGVLIHSVVDFPLRTNANMFFFLLLVTLAVVPVEYPKLYRKRVRGKKAA